MKIKEVKVEFSLYQNEKDFKRTKENLLYTFTKIIPFWYFENIKDIEKGLRKECKSYEGKIYKCFFKILDIKEREI
ncbi:hypothetical protein J7K25_03175 [bacterium]|nr:hypothetical protein [bacterium]